MQNYKLAWRNLWRNRRRTMITSASVFFAIFFALLMRSLQTGSYAYMYRNVIESYSGYVQLQGENWWDEKTIDNSFPYTSEVRDWLLGDENVDDVIPRLESFALAAGGQNTKGVMVLGIDPEKESLLSNIKSRVVQYKLTPEAIASLVNEPSIPDKTKKLLPVYENACFSGDERLLSDLGLDKNKAEEYIPILKKYAGFRGDPIAPGKPGVWLGEKLASYLELYPGDTLVLLSQGYHGSTAAGKYEIKGLIKLPTSEISGSVVYLPFDIAQQLYNSGQNLTSVVLHLKDSEDKSLKSTIERLSETAPPGTRLIDWYEMNDVIIQQMEADNVSGMFMIGILYLVIAFGIFGTVLMMTAERRREFGVLVAIGMQKKKLAAVMSYEMLYIGLLGILIGALICIPIILFGVHHPIVFKGELAHMMEEYDFEPKLVFASINLYFLWQILVVLFMVFLSLIHPLRKIMKLQVVHALRA